MKFRQKIQILSFFVIFSKSWFLVEISKLCKITLKCARRMVDTVLETSDTTLFRKIILVNKCWPFGSTFLFWRYQNFTKKSEIWKICIFDLVNKGQHLLTKSCLMKKYDVSAFKIRAERYFISSTKIFDFSPKLVIFHLYN